MNMRYQVEQFFAGGFAFGKVNEREVETRLNDLSDQGWEVVSTSASNRFFGETHYVIVILKKDE